MTAWSCSHRCVACSAMNLERSGRRGGFTLIEALVALVILGGAGMALFGWVNASIVAVRRVEEANLRSEAVANAIEYMQAVNPMRDPVGRVDLGHYALEWKSAVAAPAVGGVGYPQGPSVFQLGLFQTRVRASRVADPVWFEVTLTLVGWRRVGDSGAPF